MHGVLGRRAFLTSSATAAGLVAARHALTATAETIPADSYLEPERHIPIVEQDDVIVCGAGPAGVAAAIAAARAGAKTRLIEVHGRLGGVWTAGLLSWIIDADNKTGLMREILTRLKRSHAVVKSYGSFAYDPEQMTLLLEEMCIQANVQLRLHTRLTAAACNHTRRLRLAITESKSGREAWAGKIFVDATGDGDLAAQAGCRFDLGRKANGECQPMSLIALLTGIKVRQVTRFINHLVLNDSAEENLLAEMKRAGMSPSYTRPSLFQLHDGLFCLMANHQYGVSPLDAGQITRATLAARNEVHGLVNALRALGDPWQDLRIVATAEQIGVREGRRINGLYMVSALDLVKGARHDDAVCRVTFGIDVHSPNPEETKGIRSEGVEAKPYDIPYRALIARDVQGLLLAGRCISGDFVAHSSYRVTGNAVALGEAAGVAAALAALSRRLPQEVTWREIRQQLEKISYQ